MKDGTVSAEFAVCYKQAAADLTLILLGWRKAPPLLERVRLELRTQVPTGEHFGALFRVPTAGRALKSLNGKCENCREIKLQSRRGRVDTAR